LRRRQPDRPRRSRLSTTGVASAVAISLGVAAFAQPPAASLQLREAIADLQGVRLFYLDSGGDGPAVFLLHAGTGSARVWEFQFPAFTRAGYRVIAYDRRGHGRTVAAEGAPVGTAVDDLDALRARLGIERFHLVGTAAGGIVATDYALSFPSQLRSLVVANSLVGVQDDEYLAMGRRLRPPQFQDLPADFRELGPAYRAAHPEGTERWLALERVSRAAGPRLPPQPAKTTVTFKALEGLRVPTLLITGDADLYTPPPVLRLFAARIPNAQTVMLREVGHSAYWEQPEAFNGAVLDFLAKY
jgi:pimeloyl-ACP methyl ester carboxylesterase